jgi:hypothetical protein
MWYMPSNLRGALFAFLVLAIFGFFFLMWLGAPVIGNRTVDLINPDTGRPVTGSEARRAELIERDHKALAEYHESHVGQDAPFAP